MADVSSKQCDIGELLSAYLDGELLDGELTRVTEHLGVCLDCILEFRMLKEARTSLRLLPMLEAPDWVLDDLVHLGPELSAYLDAELSTLELPLVMQHLRDCDRCRRDLQLIDGARAAVRALPRVEPPELLGLRREQARSGVRRRWRVVSAAAGVAAALVITLGVTSSATPDPTFDLGSFADRHVARASVEIGFSMLPVSAPGAVSP
ncbi:MAG: zf-HC2 domain-containing protein [Acidimicrobiia bacterium]